MFEIHESANLGFSAGANTYALGRPGYPPDIVDWLRIRLGLEKGKTVLDLGSGTGKFLARLKQTGADITAVEPVVAMRDVLVANHPDVHALAGAAEAIPVSDASMDAVVSAQAFHWFANERTLGEIHRVLKPGGSLGLIWNVREESVDWVAALTRIIAPYENSVPRYHTGLWRNVFPARGFSVLREQRFQHQHVGRPEEVILDRILSVSFIAALPDAERQKVADQVRQVIESHPVIANQDQVAFSYKTVAFDCVRVD